MNYNFLEIEKKWQEFWKTNKTYQVGFSSKPKLYVLDMFPYPSGAGLHVGHPLGYIASDIYSRYKRHNGFNVLHPQGYDSFGLPAEQYAIKTGQHPKKTTLENIKMYRNQLDRIGFSFDWSREIRTSDPNYYKWTQWIFILMFNSYYCIIDNKAKKIEVLIASFNKNGDKIYKDQLLDLGYSFNHLEWNNFSPQKKAEVLMNFRLAYLTDGEVNWCEDLGTVLANDEIINGVSERGGFPVTKRKVKHWCLRISKYSERLLNGLDKIDWPEPLKEMQRNWIGKSKGVSLNFEVENSNKSIEVFTTRPDTIFGVSFITIAPEYKDMSDLSSSKNRQEIEEYLGLVSKKSERDRQSDVKTVSGVFSGSYAIHPFNGKKIPIWISDYVLASYGTGAVMGVPAGDQRDFDFAKKFQIDIPNIFKDIDISDSAFSDKSDFRLTNSDFLDGKNYNESIEMIINKIENNNIGKSKIQYKLRDATFSRQRYWGEPIPIYYKDGIPQNIDLEHLPLKLPEVDNFLPTKNGDSPLGNSKSWAWSEKVNKVSMNKKKIGICWTSLNVAGPNQPFVSNLLDWEPILTLHDSVFINMHCLDGKEEVVAAEKKFNLKLIQFQEADFKNSFEHIAGIASACDLIISVATTNGSVIPGALGLRVIEVRPSFNSISMDGLPWYPNHQRIYKPWNISYGSKLRDIADEIREWTPDKPVPKIMSANV